MVQKEAGFTLIEIIVTLVIVGIMGAIGVMGISQGVRGYIFAKDNSELSIKAQLAMARMNLIFMEFIDIDSASSTSVTYWLLENGVPTQETLYFDSSDNTIKIAPGANTSGGDILVDHVANLDLAFQRRTPEGNIENWSPAHDLDLLFFIVIELELARTDGGGNITFRTSVNPRNNQNLGGEPSPQIDPGEGNGCFVATAAFGKADHPVVLFLREFRDDYLSRSQAGRMFIEAYYSIGPHLAGMIQDKPLASALASVLLLPLAGLAYLLLHFSYALPVIIALTLFFLFSLTILHNRGQKIK